MILLEYISLYMPFLSDYQEKKYPKKIDKKKKYKEQYKIQKHFEVFPFGFLIPLLEICFFCLSGNL
jgi:hypothetical protein